MTAIVLLIAPGILAFAAWTIYIWATRQAPGPKDSWTNALIWYTGRTLIWVAALLLAGGLFGAAAHAVWRAVE